MARAMDDDTDIGRVRLMGLVLILSNLAAGILVATVTGSFRSLGGVGEGGYEWMSAVIAIASCGGALIVSAILLSCFWTHLSGGERNPFVGEDFLPSYADLGIVALLLLTAGWVARMAFFAS